MGRAVGYKGYSYCLCAGARTDMGLCAGARTGDAEKPTDNEKEPAQHKANAPL